MNHNWLMSRRTMLRGLGVSMALPLLDVMTPSKRSLAERVVRSNANAAYLYIPNGVADGAWNPQSVDDDGRLVRLNRWMQPLEPFRADLTVFRNFWTPRGNGHIAGTATWLTGGAFDGERLDAGGPSVDQIAGNQFKSRTLLPSLEMSTRGEGFFTSSLPRNSLSWVDARTPAPRDIEPRVIFDRMFRSGRSGLGDQSVVDLVLEDARGLKRRISRADNGRIDEYLESVRSLERRIAFATRQKERASRIPDLMSALKRPEAGIPDDHESYLRSLLDLIVLAFWSDATHVCTFMLDHGQSNRYFNFIDGVKGTWHALSHWKDFSGRTEDDDGLTSWTSREEKREMYNRVTRWHTEQVAYLLGRLAGVREPTGRLLDRSMIVYGSSLADGHEHADQNLPLLLAGGQSCGIQQGRLRGGERDTSMSRLHLAILKRLQVPIEKFADARVPLSLD